MSHAGSSHESDAVRKAASEWVARRDAGLSDAEESDFRAWRDANPRHAEALARYEKLWSHLDRPRKVGVSSQLDRDLARLQQRDRRRRARWAGTTSLLVAILGLSLWGFRPMPAELSAEPSPVVLMPKRRVLPDGTVVEYPAGSAIAVDFSSSQLRRVTLVRGEAHFRVATNPLRPFIVRAADVGVQAVGTAFSVQLANSLVEIVVTEGRVAVDKSTSSLPREIQPAATAPLVATVLDAGQKLSVPLEATDASWPSQVEPISPTEIDQRLTWRNPRMEFSDTPLSEVVAAINRYARERGGVQFTIQDPSLGSKRLSGIFRVDDTSAFIGILEKGFGVDIERLSDQLIVLHHSR
jgi:transmembrane sensor